MLILVNYEDLVGSLKMVGVFSMNQSTAVNVAEQVYRIRFIVK